VDFLQLAPTEKKMYMKNAGAAIDAAIASNYPAPVTPPPGGIVRRRERWDRTTAMVIRYTGPLEMYQDFGLENDGNISFSFKPKIDVDAAGEVVLTYFVSSAGNSASAYRKVVVEALQDVVVRTGIKVIPVWTSGAPVWAGQEAWGCTGSAWDSGEPANLETLWGLVEEVEELRAELIRQLS
jgi:hypothetical protein